MSEGPKKYHIGGLKELTAERIKKILKESDEFDKNVMHFTEHYTKFKEKYAGQCIIINHQRVATKSKNLDKIAEYFSNHKEDPIFATRIPEPGEIRIPG